MPSSPPTRHSEAASSKMHMSCCGAFSTAAVATRRCLFHRLQVPWSQSPRTALRALCSGGKQQPQCYSRPSRRHPRQLRKIPRVVGILPLRGPPLLGLVFLVNLSNVFFKAVCSLRSDVCAVTRYLVGPSVVWISLLKYPKPPRILLGMCAYLRPPRTRIDACGGEICRRWTTAFAPSFQKRSYRARRDTLARIASNFVTPGRRCAY
mmetsp:Transcript_40334/g.66998  ORF Transcript_40334/g.66998 Transcript_40334/m.66998 type:complete len:207 (+) Transcript_40334:376-996(+)